MISTVLYYNYLLFQYKNVDVDDMLGGQQDEFYQSLVNIVNNMFSYIDYIDQDQEAFLRDINDCKVFLNKMTVVSIKALYKGAELQNIMT